MYIYAYTYTCTYVRARVRGFERNWKVFIWITPWIAQRAVNKYSFTVKSYREREEKMWLLLANNVCTFYRRILNSFLFKQPQQTPVATRRATLSKNSTSNSSNLILIDSMLRSGEKWRISRTLLHVFTFFERQFILLFYYSRYIVMCRLIHITQ